MALRVQWREADGGPRPPGAPNERHISYSFRSALHWPHYTELFNQLFGRHQTHRILMKQAQSDSFPAGVASELKTYVYRLIDP